MPDKRPLHGIDLLPVLENADAPTRACALMGMFGKSVTITDGDWTLHQSPVDNNEPLYWHGYHLARFIKYELGPFENSRRLVVTVRRGLHPLRCTTNVAIQRVGQPGRARRGYAGQHAGQAAR